MELDQPSEEGSVLSKSRSQGFCHSASDLEQSSIAEVAVSYNKLRLADALTYVATVWSFEAVVAHWGGLLSV